MMTELVTKKAAAESLGVSIRTVDTYIQQGMLTKFSRGGCVHLPAAEVQELVLDRQEATGALLKRSVIADLRRRVIKLEQKVSLLLSMHEHAEPPFDLGEDEAVAMYGVAVHSLANLSVEEAERWVPLFPRVEETALVAIQEATGRTNAGALLLSLCMKLQKHLKELEKYPTDLNLQKLHYRLEYCRRHLRATLMAYLELVRGTAVQAEMGPLADVGLDALADIVDACRKKDQ